MACVFLWTPLLGLLTDRLGFVLTLAMTNGALLLAMACLLVPSLPLTYLGSLLYALGRVSLWASYFAYNAHVFGFRHFGKLVGVGMTLAACFSLLMYPLLALTITALDSDFTLANSLFVGMHSLTFLLLPRLGRGARDAAAAYNEAAPPAKEPGGVKEESIQVLVTPTGPPPPSTPPSPTHKDDDVERHEVERAMDDLVSAERATSRPAFRPSPFVMGDERCSCVVVYLPYGGNDDPYQDGWSRARVIRLSGTIAHARSADGHVGMNDTFPGVDEDLWVDALEQATGRDFGNQRDRVEELRDVEDEEDDSDELMDAVDEACGLKANGKLGEIVCDELGFTGYTGYDLYSVDSEGLTPPDCHGQVDATDWLSKLRGLQTVPRRDEDGQLEQHEPHVNVIMPVNFSKRVGRESLGVIRAYHWENEDVLEKLGEELDGRAQLHLGGREWRVPAMFAISDDDAIGLVKSVTRHLQETWGFAGRPGRA